MFLQLMIMQDSGNIKYGKWECLKTMIDLMTLNLISYLYVNFYLYHVIINSYTIFLVKLKVLSLV